MMPLGAPSISKYGSLVRPDAQIVALRAHCTRTALKAPPWKRAQGGQWKEGGRARREERYPQLSVKTWGRGVNIVCRDHRRIALIFGRRMCC